LIGEDKRQILCENTARNMMEVTKNIQLRHAAHCFMADPDYGKRVCDCMSVNPQEAESLSKLTHEELMNATSGLERTSFKMYIQPKK
jgi:catalase